MIARCGRVAGGAERLLGGEAYHYHRKLTMKRPDGGGRWEWHPDHTPIWSRSRWRSRRRHVPTAACSSWPADALGRWFLEAGKDETTDTRKAG